MKNSGRFLFIILLLVASWWLQNVLDTKPELITREKQSRFANYFLEDFSLTSHNKEGDVRYLLKAKRLDNYEEENLAELVDIQTEFYSTQSNWTLSAKKATLYHADKRIEFYDGVLINRPGQTQQPELRVETDAITLLADGDILQTDKAVNVISGAAQFQSKGLSFDNQKGILELKSNVKGRYVK